MSLPPLHFDATEQALQHLIGDMNTAGYAVVQDFIDSDTLRSLQAYVRDRVAEAGGEYVAPTGAPALLGSGLDEIGRAPAFLGLLAALYEKDRGNRPQPPYPHQVLRCLSGATGVPHSYLFHFDSFVVTALLPIEIPASGRSGDLIMWPNLRPVRSSYFGNLVDKLLLDNMVTQWLLRRLWQSTAMGFTRIKMIPGNLYLFWGYRSLHANEPCDTDKIRATALFHLGDPHAQSNLARRLRRARQPQH